MVTSEEDVPRFSLRRGARFLETFRDEAQDDEGDQGWLASLGQEPDEDGASSLGEHDAVLQRDVVGESHAASEQAEPVEAEPVEVEVSEPANVYPAALSDAVATLADRLAVLEEALARTAAACTVARVVLGEGQALLDHSSGSTGSPGAPGHPSSGKEAAVVAVRDEMAASPDPAAGPAGPLP